MSVRSTSRHPGRGRPLREALTLIALLSRRGLTVQEICRETGMQWRRVYRTIDAIRDAGIGFHEQPREVKRVRGADPTEYRIPAAELARVFGVRR